MSSTPTQYTTEFFTAEHEISLGGIMSVDAYHSLAAKHAPGASKYLFTGLFSDRVWGSFAGCPRYTPMFDGLVHTDGKHQIGHLGNGAELVRQAMMGDKAVLDFIGLADKLTKEGMGAGAAAALNKFWLMARC